MAKQVVIRIEAGDFESGFPVSLIFWEDGKIVASDRNCPQLPANRRIPQVYDRWREIYTHLGDRVIDLPGSQITHSSSLEDCQNATQALESTLRNWFNHPIFGDIRGRIVGQVKDGTPDESVRIILDTSNPYLRKLSWDRWDLFDQPYFLPQAELVLLSRYNRPTEMLQTPIKILAIFGSDRGGLQLKQDQELIETLSQHRAEITTIPTIGHSLTPQILFDTIWMGSWDIIFYAGHSSSQTIEVDHTLHLSIDSIREALRNSAKNVKLAIFNSCDGIDMAEYLADIGIPNLIVMREAVPDQVARSFLKFFLEEFTQGKPLHAAVRDARKRLQRLEIQSSSDEVFYPAASWLPVLLQNPASSELYWPQPEPKNPFLQLWTIILLLLIMTGLSSIFWVFKAFTSENIGDQMSKGEEILTPFKPRLKQKGIISIEKCQKPLTYFISVWNQNIRQQWSDCFVTHENYQQAAQYLQKSWKEERRDPETLIYLNNALLEASGEDYYTIAVVVPLLQNQAGKVVDAELAEEMLRGVAQAQTEVHLNLFQGNKTSDITLSGSEFLSANNLNGKGLKVIIVNDANSESQAEQVAETLVKRPDIIGVIGPYTSEMTMATVDTYNSNQLVVVSPGTTTSELTENPRPFFFRTPTSNHVQAEMAADVLLNQLNQKEAAIFYNPASPYSSDYQRKFRQKFLDQGGYIVDSFDISQPNFDAKRAIDKIRQSGETAIVLMPDGQVTNSLKNSIEVIKEDQGQSQILSNWSTYSPKTLKIRQPELLEKLIVTVPWHYLNSPKPNFSQTTQQLWGGIVSARTALAYDATQVLMEGIRQNPSRRGVQKALADENFSINGVTGTIEFQPGTGDRKDRPIEVVRVVPCPNRIFGLTFLPIKFSTPEDAGLNCSNP
ncbi:MAG: ABC transporter substrate-binding protein [Cyanobacteria bacterium J06592_8]